MSGNTKDAHRLVLWSASIGKQQKLLEEMFSAYFEKSKLLFSRDDLIAVSSKVGISEADVRQVLDSGEFESLEEEQQVAQSWGGGSGVPAFVIDMKKGISGAQPQEVFEQALEQALALG